MVERSNTRRYAPFSWQRGSDVEEKSWRPEPCDPAASAALRSTSRGQVVAGVDPCGPTLAQSPGAAARRPASEEPDRRPGQRSDSRTHRLRELSCHPAADSSFGRPVFRLGTLASAARNALSLIPWRAATPARSSSLFLVGRLSCVARFLQVAQDGVFALGDGKAIAHELLLCLRSDRRPLDHPRPASSWKLPAETAARPKAAPMIGPGACFLLAIFDPLTGISLLYIRYVQFYPVLHCLDAWLQESENDRRQIAGRLLS